MIGWTFGFYVRAHLLYDRLLLGRQDVGELIEVAVRREELRGDFWTEAAAGRSAPTSVTVVMGLSSF
jgi:hypothetical protein